MKHFLLTLLACLAIASCSAFDDDYFAEHQSKIPELVANKFQVHQKSAEYFAHKVSFDDSITRSVSSVEPVIQGTDTLLYIVNFTDNHGWLVISGDKRTEAILASAQTGHFNKRNIGGSAVWLEEVVQKIENIKRTNLQDTISGSYSSWLNIDTLALKLDKCNPSTLPTSRSYINYNTPKYYEDVLIDTKIEIKQTKEVGHLIQTHWGQGFPWNQYTPFWQDTKYHCPTGCVAVAGAQMLYYFHQYKGIPKTAYTKIEGGGHIWDNQKNPFYIFGSQTSETWNKMEKGKKFYTPQSEGTELVSILMVNIGSKLNMTYSIEGSSASTKKLQDVYREVGINSDYSAYNPHLNRQSLDKNCPVNIRASVTPRKNKEQTNFCSKEQLYTGHSWIIDGYKEVVTEYTYTYERRPREGGEFEEEEEKIQLDYKVHPIEYIDQELTKEKREKNEETIVILPQFGKYTKSRTDVTYYWKMNFGWEGYDDDGHYLTEESAIWDTSNGSYFCKKEIIHNFRF